MKDFRDVY